MSLQYEFRDSQVRKFWDRVDKSIDHSNPTTELADLLMFGEVCRQQWIDAVFRYLHKEDDASEMGEVEFEFLNRQCWEDIRALERWFRDRIEDMIASTETASFVSSFGERNVVTVTGELDDRKVEVLETTAEEA